MAEPVVIGIGTNKWIKVAGTKMITLHTPNPTGTYSLHSDSGVDYQVPVGKKFIALSVNASGGAFKTTGGGQVKLVSSNLSYNPATDVSGTVFFTSTSTSSYYTSLSNSQSPPPESEVYVEISAGNYVVAYNSTSASIMGINYVVTGIETDV